MYTTKNIFLNFIIRYFEMGYPGETKRVIQFKVKKKTRKRKKNHHFILFVSLRILVFFYFYYSNHIVVQNRYY